MSEKSFEKKEINRDNILFLVSSDQQVSSMFLRENLRRVEHKNYKPGNLIVRSSNYLTGIIQPPFLMNLGNFAKIFEIKNLYFSAHKRENLV